MHEANTALLDILVDNSVIIPSFQNRTSTSRMTGQNVQKLQILLFFTSYIAGILKQKYHRNNPLFGLFLFLPNFFSSGIRGPRRSNNILSVACGQWGNRFLNYAIHLSLLVFFMQRTYSIKVFFSFYMVFRWISQFWFKNTLLYMKILYLVHRSIVCLKRKHV